MNVGKEFIRQAMDAAKDKASSLECFIEITGNRYAIIEGAGSILEYDDSFIKIKVKNQVIEFWGQRLTIEFLSQDSMEIKGKIERIEYM